MLAVPQRRQAQADLPHPRFDGLTDGLLDAPLQAAGHGAEHQTEEAAVNRIQCRLGTALADVDAGLGDGDDFATVEQQLLSLVAVDGDRLAFDEEITLRGDLRAGQRAIRMGGARIRRAEAKVVAQLQVAGVEFATGSGELGTDFTAGIGEVGADLVVDAGIPGVRRLYRERKKAGQEHRHQHARVTRGVHGVSSSSCGSMSVALMRGLTRG